MSDVDRVKEAVDMVAVIGRYTKLERVGKNFKGISPFTGEKTASFFVSPDKGLWHCFSSGQGGDVFTFIQKVEGVDFGGALKMLADEAGITLSGFDPKRSKEQDRIYSVMEEALHFYRLQLQSSKPALEYVRSRGINDESIKHFSLGYAPDEWRSIKNHLQEKNIPESLVEKAGLIKRGAKGSYDVFRDRVMFPIRDTSGRVVAFSGRILSKDTEAPKYVNSPDTSIFHKSNILYGYHEARNAIRKNDFAILVEGQVDLVLSHQSGFRNTVAVSGTSFTLEHARLIKRLTDKVLMVFDNDKAGWASTLKSAKLALSLGMDVKTVLLPEGKDPADMINEDTAQWKALIRDAVHVIERALSRLEAAGDKRKRILSVEKLVIPLVGVIPNPLDKAYFVSLISERLGLPEHAVLETIARCKDEPETPITPGPSRAEDVLAVQKGVSRRDVLTRRILGIALLHEREGSGDDYYKRLVSLVDPEELPTDREEAIFEAEALFGDSDISDSVDELLILLEQDILEEELRMTARNIKRAEDSGESVDELLSQHAQLMKRLRELK